MLHASRPLTRTYHSLLNDKTPATFVIMPRKKPATTTDLPIRNPPPTPNNTPNNSPMPSPTPIPELALWQAKTLKPTHPKRTPLPNAPHSRPWIGLKAADLKRAVNRSFAKARKEKKAEAEEKRNRSVKVHGPRRVWLREEIEKLADMRENGATWAELQVSDSLYSLSHNTDNSDRRSFPGAPTKDSSRSGGSTSTAATRSSTRSATPA